MTAVATQVANGHEAGAPHVKRLGVIAAWASSLAVFFWPRGIGRRWAAGHRAGHAGGVGLVTAATVAFLNLLLTVPWLLVIAAAEYMGIYYDTLGLRSAMFRVSLTNQWRDLASAWHSQLLPEQLAIIFVAVLLALGLLLMLFFMLLPFGARPGRNPACVRHVVRTVLLGTGWVHLWGAAWAALVFWDVYTPGHPSDNPLTPGLILFVTLTLWTLIALARAVAVEYRRPGDMPEFAGPRDPLCGYCGYDLLMTESAGRCPECGRPVADSVGPHVRAGTPWERRATLGYFRATCSQLWMLVRRPGALFFSMPFLRGQRDAQRWLIAWLVIVGLEAFWIIPPFGLWSADGTFGFSVFRFTGDMFWGGVALGVVWAFLALMMVGIETAGVAAFSRIRGHPLYLAAGAKVTAFAAPLMTFWVILGGAQLVLTYALYMMGPWIARLHYSEREQQVYIAISLAVAHIGGLLWYELTVYRGVRTIQFANT